MTSSFTLPRLPVPNLAETVKNYLEEVERYTTKSQFDQTLQDAVVILDDKNVQKMQNVIIEKSRVEENWLSDYWMKYGYLKSRDSLVITTSPGLLLAQKSEHKSHSRTIAEILQAIIQYKEMLDRGKLKTEMAGKYPLCMEQYYNILGVYRVPLSYEDQMHKFISTHVIIAYRNAFYRFELYDYDGKPLSLSSLENQIENFLNQYNNMNSEKEPQLGVLTSWSRNEWSKAFTRLHKNSSNKQNMTAILNSLFILCIDSPESRMSESSEDYHDILLKHMLHGRGHFTPNRWFDKTLQLIYKLDDGYYGFAYEHTPAEGVALAKLAQMIVNPQSTIDDSLEYSSSEGTVPTKLVWKIDNEIYNDIFDASLYIQKKIDNIDCRYLKFDKFGKNSLKSLRVSPDAFIQVAYQLVYYRLYQRFTATYESGATRRFRGGRTDTIRSCTSAACEFVQEADRPSVLSPIKRDLLLAAINAHGKAALRAVTGEGVDRHLNALKWAGLENGLNIPPFFSDEAFRNYFWFRMSTSQVPMPETGVLVFGPACQDGYGICYNPQDEQIIFSITAFVSSEFTNLTRFKEALCEALEYQYFLLKDS